VLTLTEILRRHWPAYHARFGNRIPVAHRRAVSAILSCRTPVLGGQLYRCACGQTHFSYHSCHHRACPQCGSLDQAQWLSRQQQRLLPVPCFLVTFTIPQELRAVFRSRPKLFHSAFFTHTAGAMQEVSARKLKGELGFLGVFQSWSRQLTYHPHIHYIVPGLALSPSRLQRIELKDPGYLLPGIVLAAHFRSRFQGWLAEKQPQVLAHLPAKLWRQRWVVDVRPVGRGVKALEYLATYVHRSALGPDRIVFGDEQSVGLRYRDGQDGKSKVLRLPPHEFLRRFLQHVPPRGFQRVRHFGWLSAAAGNKFQRLRALLDWKSPGLILPPPRPIPLCPLCQRPMLCVGRLPRGPP
jgi:hypothetical protein